MDYSMSEIQDLLRQYKGQGLGNLEGLSDSEVLALLRGVLKEGGPGSGHHGHVGRPGQRGGSASRGVSLGTTVNDAVVTNAKELSNGKSGAVVLTFDNGENAIWKPHHPRFSNTETEVTAAQVGKLFGVNVPETVEFEYEGQRGSLQKRIKNAVTGAKGASSPTLRQCEQVAVFDLVIGNQDRHDGNWVRGEGRVWAIDHGRADWQPLRFSMKGVPVGKRNYLFEKHGYEPGSEYKISASTTRHMRGITREQWNDATKPILPKHREQGWWNLQMLVGAG